MRSSLSRLSLALGLTKNIHHLLPSNALFGHSKIHIDTHLLDRLFSLALPARDLQWCTIFTGSYTLSLRGRPREVATHQQCTTAVSGLPIEAAAHGLEALAYHQHHNHQKMQVFHHFEFREKVWPNEMQDPTKLLKMVKRFFIFVWM